MSVKQVQAIVNGQTYTLTFNSNTGKYEATVTAPNKSSYSQSGHYYGITIKATDDAETETVEDSGNCNINEHTLDALIEPQKTGIYCLRFIYKIADETWVDNYKIKVKG